MVILKLKVFYFEKKSSNLKNNEEWKCKVLQLLWKTGWQFLTKSNIGLWYDAEIPLLGIYPQKLKEGTQTDYLYTHVHNSVIHSSQQVEATHVSINGWMVKQNVV